MRCLVFTAALAMLALPGLGCGGGTCGLPENSLQGSVQERVEIDNDTVTARLSSSKKTVTIDFKKGNASVAKVVAGTEGFRRGASIPLTDGDVRRVTSPRSDFPRDVERGRVTINTELDVGSEIEGCFNVVFNYDDGTQRTLEGGFRTQLEEGL